MVILWQNCQVGQGGGWTPVARDKVRDRDGVGDRVGDRVKAEIEADVEASTDTLKITRNQHRNEQTIGEAENVMQTSDPNKEQDMSP